MKKIKQSVYQKQNGSKVKIGTKVEIVKILPDWSDGFYCPRVHVSNGIIVRG